MTILFFNINDMIISPIYHVKDSYALTAAGKEVKFLCEGMSYLKRDYEWKRSSLWWEQKDQGQHCIVYTHRKVCIMKTFPDPKNQTR